MRDLTFDNANLNFTAEPGKNGGFGILAGNASNGMAKDLVIDNITITNSTITVDSNDDYNGAGCLLGGTSNRTGPMTVFFQP